MLTLLMQVKQNYAKDVLKYVEMKDIYTYLAVNLRMHDLTSACRVVNQRRRHQLLELTTSFE